MEGNTREWSLGSVPKVCSEFEALPLNGQFLTLVVTQP